MRPLQGPSAVRGVGAYARSLLKGLIKAGFDDRLTPVSYTHLTLPTIYSV